jgi:hypothetical protein
MLLLVLQQMRSGAIGAEALAHQHNEVFAFLGRAISDRAGARPGARPYQLNVLRRIAPERVPTIGRAALDRLPSKRLG